LSPRTMYAVGGLLGLAAVGLLALMTLNAIAQPGDAPEPAVPVREPRRRRWRSATPGAERSG
ncbi:MAG: hypothetical protein ACRDLK_01035, partial [Gaiellaceae bacterium]